MFRTAVVLCLILFPLALFATANNGRTVRLGDLEVTVSAVGPVPHRLAQSILESPRAGHHFVVVSVKTKNVSEYPSCTELYPTLEVGTPESHIEPFLGSGLLSPQIIDLLPSEQSEGNFVFEVTDGTNPVELVLARQRNAEDLCAMSEGRRVFAPEIPDARISLERFLNPNSGFVKR